MLAQRLRDLVRGLDPIHLDHLNLLCGRVRQIPARKTRRGEKRLRGRGSLSAPRFAGSGAGESLPAIGWR